MTIYCNLERENQDSLYIIGHITSYCSEMCCQYQHSIVIYNGKYELRTYDKYIEFDNLDLLISGLQSYYRIGFKLYIFDELDIEDMYN